MATERVEHVVESSEACEDDVKTDVVFRDIGTTLDDAPGDWIGNPEPGQERETDEHQFARRVLGR